MSIDINDFRVGPRTQVNLEKWPTSVKRVYKSKKKYGKLLRAHVKELSSLQRVH